MKIGITGCRGRVGTILVQEILKDTSGAMELAGGTVLTSELDDSKDLGFFVTDNPDELFERSDVVIDFTVPQAFRTHIQCAAKHKKPYIIGTTGLTADDEATIAEAAKNTAIVYAANYSVGVNVLLALVEQAAERLVEDWDIEIFETHHKHKIDAPSGTALAIGKAAAAGRKIDLETTADYARHGETGARTAGNIGFSVARGGDVVGDHTAFFYGEGERVELTHRATDRSLFAKGALRAAKWATTQPAGLYSMRDVLDL